MSLNRRTDWDPDAPSPWERVGTFTATAGNGTTHTVHVEEDQSPARLPRRLWTAGGELVHWLGQGYYRSPFGNTLRSADPDAP